MVNYSQHREDFEYPIKWSEVYTFKAANLIGKIRRKQTGNSTSITNPLEASADNLRSTNGRRVSPVPPFKLCETEQELTERYGIYGPNCVIYLGVLHRMALVLIIGSLLICTPLMLLNSHGNSCTVNEHCLNNGFIYRYSLLNSHNSENNNLCQALIWLFWSACLSVFFLYLRIYSNNTYQEINNLNLTEADYSIILRRIPESVSIDEIPVFVREQLGEALVTHYRMYKKDVDELLRIVELIPLYNMDRTMDVYKEEVRKFLKACKNKKLHEFKLGQIPQPVKFSGSIIIIFNSIFASDAIESIVKRNLWEKFVSYFFPWTRPRSQFCIRGQRIAIDRAPEPSDINWMNLGYSHKLRLKRKILYSFVSLLLLGVGVAASYWNEALKQYYTKNTGNMWPIGYIVLTSILAFLLNLIIEELLIYSTKKARLQTKTSLQIEEMDVITIQQSLNLGIFSLIVPLVIYFPDVTTGLRNANVPTTIIILITLKSIINTTLTFVWEYFQVKMRISHYLLKRKLIYRTLSQVKQIFHGVELCFESKAACIVQLSMFGFLFGIICPICIPIAAVGLLLLCLYERILFNSRYGIPRYTGPDFSSEFTMALKWSPLFIGVSNLVVHKVIEMLHMRPLSREIYIILFLNIALGVVLIMAPWQKLLVNLTYRNNPNEQIEYCEKNFEITYKGSNPANSLRSIPFVEEREFIRARSSMQPILSSQTLGVKKLSSFRAFS